MQAATPACTALRALGRQDLVIATVHGPIGDYGCGTRPPSETPKPKSALLGAALPLHHNNSIAVLKPFVHSALKIELTVHGLTTSCQPSFIFSKMAFNFQRREILYSYKSYPSPHPTPRPCHLECCFASAVI